MGANYILIYKLSLHTTHLLPLCVAFLLCPRSSTSEEARRLADDFLQARRESSSDKRSQDWKKRELSFRGTRRVTIRGDFDTDVVKVSSYFFQKIVCVCWGGGWGWRFKEALLKLEVGGGQNDSGLFDQRTLQEFYKAKFCCTILLAALLYMVGRQ